VGLVSKNDGCRLRFSMKFAFLEYGKTLTLFIHAPLYEATDKGNWPKPFHKTIIGSRSLSKETILAFHHQKKEKR